MNKRTWYLMGKKLSGEATEDQRKELSYLMFAHPELNFYMEQISKWWHLAEQLGAEEAKNAFEKQLQRIEEELVNPVKNLRTE
jgi:hypothetical protein